MVGLSWSQFPPDKSLSNAMKPCTIIFQRCYATIRPPKSTREAPCRSWQ